MNQFWKKKELFSYICAIFVFGRHCSTMANYVGFPNTMNVLNTWLKYGLTGGVNAAFFILAGYLYFRNYTLEKSAEKIKKRMYSLGVPFILWNICGILFAVIVGIPVFQRFLIGRQGFSLSIENILLGVFHFKYNTPFWFIFNLIFFAFLTPVFHYMSKNKKIALLCYVVLALLIKKYPLLPPVVFTVPQSILYYFTGICLAKYCKQWFVGECSKVEGILNTLLLMGISVIFTYSCCVDIQLSFWSDIFLQTLYSLCLWKALGSFSNKVPDSFLCIV